MTLHALLYRYRRWIAVVLAGYWLMLFAGTHLPMPDVADEFPSHTDKLVHFTGYAGLSFLLGALLAATGFNRRQQWIIVAVVAVTYSITDELLQIPIEGRTADVYDALADWLGAAAGLCLLWLIRRLFATYQKSTRRPLADVSATKS